MKCVKLVRFLVRLLWDRRETAAHTQIRQCVCCWKIKCFTSLTTEVPWSKARRWSWDIWDLQWISWSIFSLSVKTRAVMDGTCGDDEYVRHAWNSTEMLPYSYMNVCCSVKSLNVHRNMWNQMLLSHPILHCIQLQPGMLSSVFCTLLEYRYWQNVVSEDSSSTLASTV